MAQLLIALDALAEDQGSVPSTHMEAHNHLYIPVPRDPTFSSALLGPRAYVWCIDIRMYRQALIHIK